ncbi:hypothetical protein CL655_00525 [bacterium]|nr:hypothetical protein [bacterium]|tara:strand:+ start:686 stop:1225 length:540 start_codon:yes stop_codon:yes gene_type:complete
MTATTKRLLIVSLITAALVGALVWLLLRLQTNAAELRVALQTIANEAAVEREFLAVSELLDDTTEQRAALSGLIVDGQQGSIDFLTYIETLASARGVTLTGTRLETAEQPTLKTNVITLSYNFSGTTTAVDAFLTQLEHIPYASYLESLTLNRQRGTAGSPEETTGSLTLQVVVTNIES